MKMMEGQLDFFNIIKNNSIDIPLDIRLHAGDTVYLVVRGDVYEYKVFDEKPWSCGSDTDNVGYRLFNGVSYSCTWNDKLGISTFTIKEQALACAHSYLNSHDVILADSMIAKKTIAFTYVRECDNRIMISFMSELDNGLLYIKEFMTYQHIMKDCSKVRNQFMKQQEFEYCDVTEIEYVPQFKNMYKCNKESNWLYAEANYS